MSTHFKQLSSLTILRFGNRRLRRGRWLAVTGDGSVPGVRGRGRGRRRWALGRGEGRVAVADFRGS
jgi:hypothetical protein